MSRSIPFLELAPMHADLADELKAKFAQLLEKGIFSGGEEVLGLEASLSEYLHIPNAIACANGTDAMELALRCLEVGQGDEVIVPALTWVSTAEVVKMVGAKVVFCEVDASGLIDLEKLAATISERTKVVIPVHLYGRMVDMDRLLGITKPLGVTVVEDAAQAFGAFQNGKSAGAYGDIGCFSFYPTKNLGALGEAGLMITQKADVAQRLRWLLNHGQSQRDKHLLAGRNSRIDTLQAAFLRVKLPYFEAWQRRRKQLAKVYLDHLQHIEEVTVPQGILQEDHNAHLFAIATEKRDKLKNYLTEKHIGTAIHYPLSLAEMPPYESGSFPMAKHVSRTTLSLPLHPYLHEDDVRRICGEIQAFFINGNGNSF